MKVFLHTWRYGMDTTLTYHGASMEYDSQNAWLLVIDPILEPVTYEEVTRDPLEGGVGLGTLITIISGDEFTIATCGVDCPVHANEVAKEVIKVL